jgi:GT2 family glycosyltransferase
MAMRRRAFEALGGFRRELKCNEDTELFMRARRRGFWVRFDEELIVWAHDHRRLHAGRASKSVHSLVRNMLLYLVCCQPRLPRVLEHDWGYWSHEYPAGLSR